MYFLFLSSYNIDPNNVYNILKKGINKKVLIFVLNFYTKNKTKRITIIIMI